jgi:hypothetical protein
MKQRHLALSLVPVAAISFAACGGDDTQAGSPAGSGGSTSTGSGGSPQEDSGTITEPADTGATPTESSTPTGDAAPAGGPCPAPAAAANQYVVYGDGAAAGWEFYGFHGSFAAENATVCSGTEAVLYKSGQFDGVAFDTDTMPVDATHLSVRVHVDVASKWAVAAVKPGETDPHQFIGDTNGMDWTPGWQDVELDIPSTTPQTRWILFEKQDQGQTEIVIDDVRLTKAM